MEADSILLLKQKSKDLKVLYVEDQNKVRIQTSKILNIFFDDVVQATNGKEGLSKFTDFDIIFTDVKMPVMNGLEMIKQMRKKDQCIPIVILSAYDDKEYLLESIKYEISGYIIKPFRFNEIYEVIKKIMNKLESNQQKEHLILLKDGFIWNSSTHELYKNNEIISLTKHETMLFTLLSSCDHTIFSSQEIELELFDDAYTDNKRVRSLISRLKNKIGVALIQSIYSQGYKLNLEKEC